MSNDTNLKSICNEDEKSTHFSFEDSVQHNILDNLTNETTCQSNLNANNTICENQTQGNNDTFTKKTSSFSREIFKGILLDKNSNFTLKSTNSSYISFREYHGVVTEINSDTQQFSASMINISNDLDQINAEFGFDEITYQTERNELNIGAHLVWIIGKEKQDGTLRNISTIRFRHMPMITKRKIEKANEIAREWSSFFGRPEVEGSSD